MGRSIPQGRDRLGMLGRPFGVSSAALSGTDTEFRLGTADFIMEYVGLIPYDTSDPTRQDLMRATEDANDFVLSFRQSSNCFRLTLGGTSSTSSSPSFDIAGHLFHLIVFGDRSGNAYFYLDGEPLGSVDISGEVAININSDTVLVGGQVLGSAAGHDFTMLARLFVLSDAFPTSGECANIAKNRYLNPDAESPVLAARAAYATERRLDVDFIDTHEDATTIVNHGTGSDLTIRGGLEFNECRVQAERTAIDSPQDNWYSLDESHDASGTGDIGLAVGSYIVETVYKDITHPGIGDPLYEIQDASANERARINIQSNITITTQFRVNGTFKTIALYDASGAEYGRHGLHVVHQLFEPDTGNCYSYVNGQKIGEVSTVDDLDLSGAVTVDFGDNNIIDGLLAIRVWNLAGASAPLPSDYHAEILQRVINPWSIDGAFASMGLKGRWELRDGAQLSGSTTITNLANPGTCDLTVSGGSTFGDARIVKLRGL